MKSEFKKAPNQKKASHTHNCKYIKPYADENLLDMFGSKEIKCRVCGFVERRIESPSGANMTTHFTTTNTDLQSMIRSAQENWDLDEETAPGGTVAQGLKNGAYGDLEDSEVSDVFQVSNFPKGDDKWDALEIWAKAMAR